MQIKKRSAKDLEKILLWCFRNNKNGESAIAQSGLVKMMNNGRVYDGKKIIDSDGKVYPAKKIIDKNGKEIIVKPEYMYDQPEISRMLKPFIESKFLQINHNKPYHYNHGRNGQARIYTLGALGLAAWEKLYGYIKTGIRAVIQAGASVVSAAKEIVSNIQDTDYLAKFKNLLKRKESEWETDEFRFFNETVQAHRTPEILGLIKNFYLRQAAN